MTNFKHKQISKKNFGSVTKTVIEFINPDKKMITLKDVKEFARNKLDKDNTNGSRYVIYGRNDYRDHAVIRDYSGAYVDDNSDYYEDGNFQEDIYNNFYKIGIAIVTPNKPNKVTKKIFK